MKTLRELFKTISLRQLVVVFLAGVFMLVTTACSGTPRAAVPTGEGYNPDTPGQAMYPHKDTKRDTSAADAKADRLVRQAEQRQKKIQGPGDYLDEVEPGKTVRDQAENVGKSAQRAAKNVTSSAEQAAENVGKSTKRAAENAAESTQKGLNNVREGVSEAADQATDAVESASTPNFPNS
jgi:membrane-associated HD superfamily phosphohydrolase